MDKMSIILLDARIQVQYIIQLFKHMCIPASTPYQSTFDSHIMFITIFHNVRWIPCVYQWNTNEMRWGHAVDQSTLPNDKYRPSKTKMDRWDAAGNAAAPTELKVGAGPNQGILVGISHIVFPSFKFLSKISSQRCNQSAHENCEYEHEC